MTTPPPRKPRTGAVVTIVIGIVLLIGGPITGVIGGAVSVVPQGIHYAESVSPVNPTATVDLDSGGTAVLLSPTNVVATVTPAMCTARSANGSLATVSADWSSYTITTNGAEYKSFARVTALASGETTITCDTSAPVVVAPALKFRELLGSFAWWLLGGAAVAVVGLAVLIVGILRLRRVNRLR